MRRHAGPKNLAFVSPLATALDRFLRFKRSMGFRYQGLPVHKLDRFLASRLVPNAPAVITQDLIRGFVARRGAEAESTRIHRLSLIRQFCLFRKPEDPRTEIPAKNFLPIRRSVFVPRVLSLVEGQRFLKACLALPPGRCSPLRGIVHGAALATLYLTGLRLGEALGLSIADVDLASAILKIRHGKFGKSRLVPIATDLNELLRRCRDAVASHFGPQPADAPFFLSPRGGQYNGNALHASFESVLAAVGIPGRRRGGPRLHDLRHSFTVHRVVRWYQGNEDFRAKLPLLAVYLGHVNLASTQRYLRITEDVLGEITRRHQARFGYLIKERGNT